MWNWLVNQGHIYSAFVGWAVGALMTGGFIGLICRPAYKRIRRALHVHEQTQDKIAQRLDARSPGGLGDLPEILVPAIMEAVENIERGTD